MSEEPACKTETDASGRTIWNGLRVRMGINIGEPEPVVNKAMWRVDYFGPPVNLAARVESKACGGQTLITEAVYNALSPALRENPDDPEKQFFTYTSIGPQNFKGMQHPVQVLAPPLLSLSPAATSSARPSLPLGRPPPPPRHTQPLSLDGTRARRKQCRAQKEAKGRTKGKDSLWLLEAPVRKMVLQMHPPARTGQCWSRQTPAWTRSVPLDAPGQRHGQQLRLRDGRPPESSNRTSHPGAPLTRPQHVRAHRGSE